MILWQLLLRQWRQRPGRNLLSLVSVALAVAAVLGTAIAQSSVRIGYTELTEKLEGAPSLDVVAADGERFAADTVPPLADVPGVASVTPIAVRGTSARTGGKPFRMLLAGMPPAPDPIWDSIALVEGEPCREEKDAVLAAEVAESLGAKLGDRVTVLTRRGPRSVNVVGLAAAASLHEVVPGCTQVVPLAAVQEWFRFTGDIDRLHVALASSDDRDAVKDALQARLGDEFVVQAPADQAELVDSVLRSTELALKFAGALSLALAGFIIVNTLRMNFSERRRQLAILRLVGATSRQIEWLHLLEGVAFGVLGTAAGIPLGILLGRGLAGAMAALLRTEIATPALPLEQIALAAVLGPVVAALAAILPAWRARKVSPAEALGDEDLRRADRPPILAGILALALWGAAAYMLTQVMNEKIATEFAIPAGIMMLVAFIAFLPVMLGPVVRLTAALMSPLVGALGPLAAEQVRRRPTRTGLTVGVLVVALSNGLGLGTAVVSNVEDIRNWYRRTMSGDFFITDPTAREAIAASREQVRRALAEHPDVARVVQMNVLPARAESQPIMCVARDFPPEKPLPWDVGAGREQEVVERLAAGDAVLSSVLAAKLDVEVGDTVRLHIQGRVHTVRTAALVSDYMLGGMTAFLDRQQAAEMFDLGPAGMYIIEMKEPSSSAAPPAWLDSLAREEGLVLQSFTDMRNVLDRLINGIVGALWGLLAVGFIVGGFGIANTLAMSVLEQTREFGLLRTVGMTPGQIYRLVCLEALLFAVAGCLAGGVAGLTTAWVIFLTNEPLVGHAVPFVWQPGLIAANLAGCFVVALVAALLPGRRAARLDLPSALAYE